PARGGPAGEARGGGAPRRGVGVLDAGGTRLRDAGRPAGGKGAMQEVTLAGVDPTEAKELVDKLEIGYRGRLRRGAAVIVPIPVARCHGEPSSFTGRHSPRRRGVATRRLGGTGPRRRQPQGCPLG